MLESREIMKKGFTLIELLAVIIILAILALIVMPIISGVISDAKKSSAERSVENYVDAIELAEIKYQYKSGGISTQSLENLKISASDDSRITVSNIEIGKDGLVDTGKFIIDDFVCNYVNEKAVCIKLQLVSIEVIKQPNKTKYIENELFDETGMIVIANYNDESTKIIIPTYSNKALKANASYVELSYKENKITKTTNVPISVSYKLLRGDGQEVSGRSYVEFESPLESSKLQSVKVDNVVVTSDNYSITNTNTTIVTFNASYLYKLNDGIHVIDIVSSNGTATGNFSKITVLLTAINVTTMPFKTSYVEEEMFDVSGMVVKATFSNGNVTTILPSISISPLVIGTTSVNISYTDYGVTKTTTVPITVIEKPNKSLINTLISGGKVIQDPNIPGRYIYKGNVTTNYIYINEAGTNVKYRIISFEKDGTVKIVRDDSIGNMTWDTSYTRENSNNTFCYPPDITRGFGCAAWGNMKNTYRNGVLMNDYFSFKYYNTATDTVMTTYGTETGNNKTTVIKDSWLNEYLNTTFLTTKLSNVYSYIDNHAWDVGMIKQNTGKTLSKEIEESKTNQWIGKVALISIIDYVNASGNASCISVISGLGNTYCSKTSSTVTNYLYKTTYTYLWFLDANTENFVWITNAGKLTSGTTNGEYAVRPSFYLNNRTKISGTGSSSSPYTISKV